MREGFDAKKETVNIVKWIKTYFAKQSNSTGAIIGISGGKDSTIVAKLLVEALGKENVFGVLMPNGNQKDIRDSLRVIDLIGIRYELINIDKTYKKLVQTIGSRELTSQAQINIAPRIRMTVLYAMGSSMGYRVCGTGNLSERFVGYTTKWGDNVCDFNPIGNLTTEEVRAIGDYLALPFDLVHKIPSDGLCDKSDEDSLGFTYDQVNLVIEKGTCGDRAIDNKILSRSAYNRHKSEPIPMY